MTTHENYVSFYNEKMFSNSNVQHQDTIVLKRLYEMLGWKTNLGVTVVIVLLATSLNSIILKIYKDRKHDLNKKYVVALAIVDIAACWITKCLDLGQAMALAWEVFGIYQVLFVLMLVSYGFVIGGYPTILLMWAFERLFAVACPFTFREKLKVFMLRDYLCI